MTTVDAGLFPAERASWETLDGPAVAERGDANAGRRTRGWLVRRMLLAADVAGLTFAFLLALRLAGGSDVRIQLLVLVLALPVWVVAAKLAGLYGRDEERTDHSTLDEAVTVFALVTVGAWLGFLGLDAFGHPRLAELADFWAFAVAAVALGRTVARLISRRSVHYLQNAVIVGGGEVGQLVARKFRLHPEYGVRVVGFVDEAPRERRGDLVGLPLLGAPLHLRRIVQTFDVERVVVAFSRAADEETIAVVRSVRDLDVQVDVVPRLFDLVGPRADLHTVEGLTMLGLPPVELTPSSLLLKRMFDLTGAGVGLLLAAPLLALVALAIKLDSPGPVLFRQTRLGRGQRPFTVLKFRTMVVGADAAAHREFVRGTMANGAVPPPDGLYKLRRDNVVTRVGRILRRTSVDELPQLWNVLRGEMSLVGPRPCLPYELEHFEPHHVERFRVLPGITGLWQVTARARATFGEALEMDVAYVQSWSLGLDLRLLLRTPLELFRRGATV